MAETSNKLEDREIYIAVMEILEHEDVQKLDQINHHGKSILDHSLKVAFLSWKWGDDFTGIPILWPGEGFSMIFFYMTGTKSLFILIGNFMK